MVRLNAAAVKSEDDVSGFQKPLPGRYHVAVKHVDESFEKFDKVLIDFEVLAGTVPDQAGRELTEFFSVTEKALPRLQRLALCIGLLQPGEADKEIDFTAAIGSQLVIEIEENKYTDRKTGKEVEGVRVAYLGMWSLNNAAVADVPKAADVMGYETRQAAATAVSQGNAATSQPATVATAAVSGKGGGGWDDI